MDLDNDELRSAMEESLELHMHERQNLSTYRNNFGVFEAIGRLKWLYKFIPNS